MQWFVYRYIGQKVHTIVVVFSVGSKKELHLTTAEVEALLTVVNHPFSSLPPHRHQAKAVAANNTSN